MLIKKQKKGQAALEFMMTYGWAILALITTVAVFAFIVPHTGDLTTNKCIFGAETPCLGAQLNSRNVTILLQNGLGQTIYNINANMTTPINNNCTVSKTTLKAEEKLTIVCDNSIVKIKPNSKIRMTVKYKKVKNGYDQIVLGEIYAK
jgi:uncharacterized protein (UPF0333 family)